MGALNQINNGATTLVDWCHNDPTLEHSIGPVTALEASTDDEHHRKRIRDGLSPHRARQRMSLEQDGADHDLQTRRGRREELASSRRSQPATET
jgi:hypothetical protein